MNYKQGWNDRVTGKGGEYGQAYLGGGDQLMANSYDAQGWSRVERAEYVRGWTDANEKVKSVLKSLVLP